MEGPPGNFDPNSTNYTASEKIKNQRESGIISRSVQEIFDRLENSGSEYSVRVSHLELYNEDLCDLLSPSNDNLKLLEDPKNGVQVHNLAEIPVYNPQDIFKVLEKSWTERRTAETVYNKHSSRSHCVFSIIIHIKECTTEGEDLIKVGKLNLVDLAGSENISRSGADKFAARKQEAGNINKSLLTLGRVITALTESAIHVPYRESKLTRLLQDSLGGKTKTCIIATISPSSGNIEETMSTLEYAFRAKNIKNRPEINQKMAKRQVIKEYTSEINTLRIQLESMRKQIGVYLPTDTFNKMEKDAKEAKEKVILFEEILLNKERELEELKALFDQKSVEHENAEIKLVQIGNNYESTKLNLETATKSLEETKTRLEEQKFIVQEHQKTETEFHNKGEIVLNNLNQVIEDTSGLFSKIEREENLSEKNKNSTQNFHNNLSLNLESAQKEFKLFTNDLNSSFKSLETFNCDLKTIQSREISKTSEDIKKMQNTFIQKYNLFKESLLEDEKSQNQDIINFKNKQKSLEFELIEAIQNEKIANNAGFDQIQSIQDINTQNVNNWYALMLKADEDTGKVFNKIGNERKSSWMEIDQKISQFTSNQQEIISNDVKILKDFVQEQTSNLETFKKNFIKNMTEILDSSISTHIDSLTLTAESIVSNMLKTIDNNKIFQKESNLNITSELEKIQNFEKQLELKNNQITKSISDYIQSHFNFSDSTNLKLIELKKNSNKDLDELKFTISNNSIIISKILEQSIENSNNLVEKNQDKIDYLIQMMENSSKELKNDIIHQSNQIEDFSYLFDQQIKAIGSVTSEFEKEFNSSSQFIQSQINKFELETYKPIGETPVKKDLGSFSPFVKTRIHDDIINEYRILSGEGFLDDKIIEENENRNLIDSEINVKQKLDSNPNFSNSKLSRSTSSNNLTISPFDQKLKTIKPLKPSNGVLVNKDTKSNSKKVGKKIVQNNLSKKSSKIIQN